jgi:hypothetical protein
LAPKALAAHILIAHHILHFPSNRALVGWFRARRPIAAINSNF